MPLSRNDVNEEELRRLYYDKRLSDKQIADLFNISRGKVAYKRKKFGISIRKSKYVRKLLNKGASYFSN